MKRVSRVIFRLCLGLLLCAPLAAELLGSSISVQGVLSDAGVPADGVYDLRLTPYPAAASGAPLVPAVEIENIQVIEGAFTTKVDFGSVLFLGDIVFLEIAVRDGNATGSYDVLTPRQELTAAPYALKPRAASVTDLEIANGAVGSAQVLDASIGSVDLASGAVTTTRLADSAVATAKLADQAVTGSKVADASLTTVKLADQAVTSIKVADASLTSVDLADNAVTAPKIADGAVGTLELANAAVTTAKLAPNAVDTTRVLDGSLTAADFASGVLGAPSWTLAGNAIGAGQFLGTTNGAPLALRSDVGVTVNGDRFNNNTELTLRGNPLTVEPNADLALWPRDGTAFFNLSAIGTDPATSAFTISAVGTSPFTGFLTRMRLAQDGSFFVGSTPSVAANGSFVFADGLSATPFNSTASAQFLVRAGGGVGINRLPQSTGTELSVGPDAAGGNTDVVLGATGTAESIAVVTLGTRGTDTSYELSNAGSPSGNAFFTIANRNNATTETPALQIISDGSVFRRYLSLFRGNTDGSYLLPSHPIHVGASTIPNSGNGAHLTFGGVWTNGSSVTFKRDFAAIDSADVLRRVLELPLMTWRYRDEPDIRHLGPTAEDFKAAFGLGGDPQYIGTVDADGVALAALQGLDAKLERENASLRAALADALAKLEALEARVNATLGVAKSQSASGAAVDAPEH